MMLLGCRDCTIDRYNIYECTEYKYQPLHICTYMYMYMKYTGIYIQVYI